jgi:hypothetical protein
MERRTAYRVLVRKSEGKRPITKSLLKQRDGRACAVFV